MCASSAVAPLSERPRSDPLALSASLPGWLAPEEAEALLQLAARGPGQGALVEIGSFVGKSLLCLAAGSRREGRERVVSIDPHRGSAEHQPGGAAFVPEVWDAAAGRVDTLGPLRRNLTAAGLSEQVEVVVATSDEAAAD